MKRRLNILCLIVVLVLSYSVLETGYYFFIGAKAGVEAVTESKTDLSAKAEIMNMKYVSLVPHSFSLSGGNFFNDSVYNEKSGAYLPAIYSSMVVSVDSKPTVWESITDKVLNFLQLIMYVWAIVLFIRLIISINKSDIFKWRNVRRLRRMGIALIIGFCCTFITAYLNLCSVEKVFSLHGYELGISDMVSTTMLVLGLSALIVAEVFAIGLKMKEEQDLTI